MISLGLDASTSTVGFAFVEDKKILSAGFIDVSKVEGNRSKAWFVVDFLKKNLLVDKVEQINLEASLSGFSGPSNRKVVILLARYNAVLEYVLQDWFKKRVNLVNVSTARKQAFGKARIKGVKSKAFVESQISKLYDLSKWEIKNKKGTLDKRIEDVRDAIVIALFTP